MSAIKIIGAILIIAGLLGLIRDNFSYTRETRKNQETRIGSLEVFVTDTQTVHVPVWASVGAIMVGGLLLTLASKKG